MTRYLVLYTHQKLKKQKTWQDGFLTILQDSKKAVLSDSSGISIDSLFLTTDQLCKGYELESEKFLITIEEKENESKKVLESKPVFQESKASWKPAKKHSFENKTQKKPCIQTNVERISQDCLVKRSSPLDQSLTSLNSSNSHGLLGTKNFKQFSSYDKTIEAENKLQVNDRKRNVCDIIALFDCCDERESVNYYKKKISQKSLECKGAQKMKEQNNDTAIEQVPLKDCILETSFKESDQKLKSSFKPAKCIYKSNILSHASERSIGNFSSAKAITAMNNQLSMCTEFEYKDCFNSDMSTNVNNGTQGKANYLKQMCGKSFSVPLLPNMPSSTFFFPSHDDVKNKKVPKRQTIIPVRFDSVTSYKQVFKSALMEHLNIVLFSVAIKYFEALACVDVSAITKDLCLKGSYTTVPSCEHGLTVMRTVQKDGKNKGRTFFCCSSTSQPKCNFFVWVDETSKCNKFSTGAKTPILDQTSAVAYLNSKGVEVYFGVKFLRKTHGHSSKVTLFLLLPIKKPALRYNKDDLWVVSKTFDFKCETTFIAKSVFYGPNSVGELEVSPLSGYSRGDWHNGEVCYAIQAYNASSELVCCSNLDHFLNPIDVPILRYLIESPSLTKKRNIYQSDPFKIKLPASGVLELLNETVHSYNLNQDQAAALEGIANMFLKDDRVILIHGVFGSGKSYLLSTVVVFLTRLFLMIKTHGGGKIKVLVSSATNVAVDRVLQGLLDIGFESFVRVGSVKKIAKSILPYTVHASEEEDNELRELNDILKTDLSVKDRGYVRKAIEHHKLGVNRKKLADVNVVGVTCAACVFPYLQKLEFKVQLLDECTQMLEPLCMLPIARFRCERLILVGDPKQLSPTIQGSESEHKMGLEMTLFERMQKLSLNTYILRTQYRCHPSISSVCNQMFYDNKLLDGVTADERQKIIDWLPTLSFIDVDGHEKCELENSYCNVSEAHFVVRLLELIFKTGIDPYQIGVITQYKSQVAKITSFLRESKSSFTSSDLKAIQMSTVDAFQGAEKEIIILSCVRSQHIGFIDCPFRTNVALSRAKRHLVVAGNKTLLAGNTCWSAILNICKLKDAIIVKSDEFLKDVEKRIVN